MARRVHVLTLGGTIAITPAERGAGVTHGRSGTARRPSRPRRSRTLPPAASALGQAPNLRLSDMVELRHRIAELLALGYGGTVITQGTNAIEEGASDRSAAVNASSRPRDPSRPRHVPR